VPDRSSVTNAKYDKDTRKQHKPQRQYRVDYAACKYARVHWIRQSITCINTQYISVQSKSRFIVRDRNCTITNH